jgi:hypothetical protein
MHVGVPHWPDVGGNDVALSVRGCCYPLETPPRLHRVSSRHIDSYALLRSSPCPAIFQPDKLCERKHFTET